MENFKMKKWLKFSLGIFLFLVLLFMTVYYLKSLEPVSKGSSNSVIKPSFNNDNPLTFLAFIEKLSGHESPKKYLFLFQNSMELRPTGGFIGSFAVVDIDKGKIVKRETFDTAVFDRDLKEHIEPPYFIKKYLHASGWGIRDSNWSFNFPTSATQTVKFYKLGSTPTEKIDGVIGFTTNVLEYLIGKTGSVKLPMIAGEFTKDNCLEKLEYEVEMGYNQRGATKDQRKDIMGDLMEIVLARLMEMNKLEQALMLTELKDLLDKKDIQFFFFDSQLENFVLDNNWGGEIISTKDTDYLAVVDSNLGARKTDRCLERFLDYYIDTTEVANPQVKLEIQYTNTCTKKDFMTDNYHSYLRIYTPQGAEISHTDGFDTGYIDESMLTKDNVVVEEVKGKISFGNLAYVPLGSKKSYSFTYKLSPSVNLADYQLYFQKQAGMKSPHLKVTLKNTQGEKILFEGEVDQDILIP
ncbi:MAG: DUF4012 domain-containing protein [Patescibacteria group bacterium]|nr:DUF4012 domain-containing protein [Patescibacteria group bacterium]